MRFNDIARGDEGRHRNPVPGQPDCFACRDCRDAARDGVRRLAAAPAAAPRSGAFAHGRQWGARSRSNRSTARRRRCSTGWSACWTANRSFATCRSCPAKAQASYRVRSYLAAQVSRGRTTIAWVWDVYDRNQQRALRLSGEEPAGKAGRDAWTAADDLVLRRIAQAGLSGLSAMVNGTAPADEPPPPPRRSCAARRWRARTSPRRPRVHSTSAPSATALANGQISPCRAADFAQENRLHGLPAAPPP